MGKHGVEQLNEGQRACLRLVVAGLKSAAIAHALGISPHTVDQRLRVANRILGVGSRGEAARILAAHEGVEPYQALIYQSPDIAAPLDPGPQITSPGEQAIGSAATGPVEVREIQAAFAPLVFPPRQTPLPPDPPAGKARNGLSKPERIAGIVDVAMKLATVACVALLLAILVSLSLKAR